MQNISGKKHFFLLSDGEILEFTLAACHGRSWLPYNECTISGELCLSYSRPRTADDWEGGPRHMGQVSYCNE